MVTSRKAGLELTVRGGPRGSGVQIVSGTGQPNASIRRRRLVVGPEQSSELFAIMGPG